jgi:hypothetical protein
MVRRLALLVAPLFMAFAPTFALAADIREGSWEVTTRIDTGAMAQGPASPLQPMTQTLCLRNSDLNKPESLIPLSAGCRMIDSRVQGSQMSWQLQCGALNGTGQVNFQSDSYQGTAMINLAGMAGGGAMLFHYSGRRIGDCR